MDCLEQTLIDYVELVHKETKDFKPDKVLNSIMNWLDNYCAKSNTKKVVIGISGGKDSTVAAKILVDYFGKENVFGILMPNGEQKDISDSIKVVDLLGIEHTTINIGNTYSTFIKEMKNSKHELNEAAEINVVPRLRMLTLYSFGQSYGYRVAGTGNLSERLLGYFTKWGDGACDFNILGNLTSLEVMRLGEYLGLPLELCYKAPADGLTGLTDEENLGISYIDMHRYIRLSDDKCGIDKNVIDVIKSKNLVSQHKLELVPIAEIGTDYE